MKKQRTKAPEKKLRPLPSVAPNTFRLPKRGQTDPYFGGTRTFWNEQTLARPGNNWNPPVKSFVIKSRPGAKRGIRFIDYQSALAWFEEQYGVKFKTPEPAPDKAAA